MLNEIYCAIFSQEKGAEFAKADTPKSLAEQI